MNMSLTDFPLTLSYRPLYKQTPDYLRNLIIEQQNFPTTGTLQLI